MASKTASWVRLSSRAAAAHRGLLTGLALLAVGFSLLLTGLSGYLAVSATAQAVGVLDTVGESQRVWVVQTRMSDDPDDQLAAANDAIDFAVPRGAALVTSEQVETGGQRFVRWTFTPHPTGFTAAAIPELITGLESLQSVFSADPAVATSGVTTEGSLTTTLADIQRRLGAEQGASLVPLGLVAVVGVVALGQVSRLQSAARAPELGLIRSRGASFRRLGLTAALETAAVTIPAALVGAAIALGALTAMYPSIAVDVALWNIPVGIGLAAAAVVAAATVSTTRAASLRDPAFAGRRRTAVGVTAVVLVVVVAGLSLWQFTLYGSPVVQSSGGSRVEPLLAFAPALTLLALVVVGLALFAPAIGLAESVTARSRGVRPSFPIRQVARRVGVHAVSVTVVALAVGSLVLAAGYTATLRDVSALPSILRTGSDIRVVGGPDGLASPEYLDGLDYAPVLVTTATVGGDAAEVLGIPSSSVPTHMTDLEGALDTEAIAQAITPDREGIDIGGMTEIPVEITVESGAVENTLGFAAVDNTGASTITVSLVVADEFGDVTIVEAPPIERPGPNSTISTSIAATLQSPYQQVLGVAVNLGVPQSVPLTITISSIAGVATTGDWALTASRAEDFDPTPPALGSAPASVTIAAWSATTGVQLYPESVAPTAAVPAVVSSSLADRLSLETGDVITVRSESLGDDFDISVAGVVAAVPGTTNAYGIIVDLGAVGLRRLTQGDFSYPANQYWIRSEDAAADVARISPDLDDSEITVARSAPAAETPTQLALDVGALGALLLAAATLLAGNGMVSRSRAGELRVLRALGMRRREIGAARRLEVVVVVAFAVALGAASGALVALLTIPALARSATIGLPPALDVPLAFHPLLLGLGAIATVAVLGIATIIAGAQSVSKEERE